MFLHTWKQLFTARLRQSRRRRRRRIPVRVSRHTERLEDRTLLSSASFVDGVFQFTADPGQANQIIVSQDSSLITIRDNSGTITPTGSVAQGADANEVTFDAAQVTKVQLELDDGDDTATAAGLAISST